MNYVMTASGTDRPATRVFPVNTEEFLHKGIVVTLRDGMIEKATDEDEIFGVLAEDYDPVQNEFNPNSGTGMVRVIISPDAFYFIYYDRFIVNETSTPTTVVAEQIPLPEGVDLLKGGYIRLLGKTDSSKNTDDINVPRKILSSDGNVLTVEEGGIAEPGDYYLLIPPIGYDALELSPTSFTYRLCDKMGGKAKIVCNNPDNSCCEIMFKKTFFNK